MPHRPLLALLLLMPLSGCPSGDDDDSAVDDDDSGTDDDDTSDDDDTVGDDDDDDDDDDDGASDFDQATPPDFAGCDPTQNQFLVMLGDGSTIGPFSGFQAAPASFANVNNQWQLRMGDSTFAQLQGNREGYTAGSAVTLQGPAATPGNAVVNVAISLDDLDGADAAMGGGYGLPTLNADSRVGGEITFSVLPEPDATATGTFSATLQHNQQLRLGNTVLLGITGCFQATLTASDGG